MQNSDDFREQVKRLRREYGLSRTAAEAQAKAVLRGNLPVLDKIRKSGCKELKNRFAHVFEKRFLISCFSKDARSILMWSHYASQHSGVVLGYRKSELQKCIPMLAFVEVCYREERPFYHHSAKTERFQRNLIEVASTKSRFWEYEKEVRILIPSERLDGDGLFQLEAGTIRMAILGCRCSEEDKELVLQACVNSPNPIQMFQAEIDERKYRLKLRSIH